MIAALFAQWTSTKKAAVVDSGFFLALETAIKTDFSP
jgi:hypothetical protein